ncbi:MAG: metallophosphoesterase family protein [Verrucomicrobiales bacterium]
MSTYAIGDIHGCAKAFRQLVDWIAPGPDDTLVTLGDYIDRGPNSRGVVKFLRDLRERTRLIPLKGNHELILEEAILSSEKADWWKRVGGRETLDSYGVKSPGKIPWSHLKFLARCAPFHETATHVFVHGGVLPNVRVDEHTLDELAWLRVYDAEAHQSGKIVICGHTPQRDGRPLDLGHTICLDTWAYKKGWLTCLEVESGKYWQVKEKGKKGGVKRRQGALW